MSMRFHKEQVTNRKQKYSIINSFINAFSFFLFQTMQLQNIKIKSTLVV